MDDAQLHTIWQQRQWDDGAIPLAQPLAALMKYTLGKRVRQLSQLAEVWDEVIPESIADHTALESFRRGVLTVVVDSAPHRFQLQTLLRGGLTDMLRERFSGALQKVRLVPGQFCAVDVSGRARYEF